MERSIVLEDVATRSVILHYHVMKNAGSTIVSVLEREFGDGFAEVHRAANSGLVEPEDVVDLVRTHAGLRALSSHHLHFPAPDRAHAAFFTCYPLRHPIDRLASLYAYYRKHAIEDFPGALALRHDLPGFLEALLDRHPNYVYNVQTIFVGVDGRFRAAGLADLRVAEERIRRSAIVAAVHRLDESLALAEYFCEPAFPGLRLHYAAQNVTRPIGTSLAAREAALREECGATYERIAALNTLDFRLLAIAEDELDARIATVPDFERRLADFRARCEALAAATA